MEIGSVIVLLILAILCMALLFWAILDERNEKIKFLKYENNRLKHQRDMFAERSYTRHCNEYVKKMRS